MSEKTTWLGLRLENTNGQNQTQRNALAKEVKLNLSSEALKALQRATEPWANKIKLIGTSLKNKEKIS